jgi:hypothetical protein
LTDNVALPAQHSTEKSKVMWKENEKYVFVSVLGNSIVSTVTHTINHTLPIKNKTIMNKEDYWKEQERY